GSNLTGPQDSAGGGFQRMEVLALVAVSLSENAAAGHGQRHRSRSQPFRFPFKRRTFPGPGFEQTRIVSDVLALWTTPLSPEAVAGLYGILAVIGDGPILSPG